MVGSRAGDRGGAGVVRGRGETGGWAGLISRQNGSALSASGTRKGKLGHLATRTLSHVQAERTWMDPERGRDAHMRICTHDRTRTRTRIHIHPHTHTHTHIHTHTSTHTHTPVVAQTIFVVGHHLAMPIGRHPTLKLEHDFVPAKILEVCRPRHHQISFAAAETPPPRTHQQETEDTPRGPSHAPLAHHHSIHRHQRARGGGGEVSGGGRAGG